VRKDLRLRQTRLFDKVYREGKSIATAEVVLCFLNLGSETSTQVGFSINKKVGNAVTRNRVKRRLKNIIESTAGNLRSGFIIVFVGRPLAAESSFSELKSSAHRLLRKANILEDSR
jgi:ribonuclease P protein component